MNVGDSGVVSPYQGRCGRSEGVGMKLLVLAFAWIVGLLIGLELDVYLPALVLYSVAALILALLLWTRGVSPWPALLAVVVLIGILRVDVSDQPEPLAPSDGLQPTKVRGLVSSDPETSGPGVEFRLSVDAVDRGQGWEGGAGRILVIARPSRGMVESREEPYFRYGDRLELTGPEYPRWNPPP